jgi:beta-glucosidase
MTELRFASDFVWGVATSSYQIEGAIHADGRAPSIWDTFCSRPGAVEDGSDGAVACDHYHRFADDVALMKELGVDAYRFSVAWPRVVPGGTGPVNQRGLDFYERLVDALLAAGIAPYVTLFHWDLPQSLEDAGGWPVRATADAFVEYVAALVGRLGDRVQSWITHNEPWCTSMLGYHTGRHAPGRQSLPDALAASHHLLLSHGMAVPVIRELSKGARVGITLNCTLAHPASASEADRALASWYDGYFNRWFLDPVHGRGYPEDMLRDHRDKGNLPADWDTLVRAGDLATIAVPCDFLGLNYYTRAVFRSSDLPEAQNLPVTVRPAPAEEWTDMGWEVYPDGLHELLTRVHREYRPRSLYVTENGASYGAGPDASGRVPDQKRVDFLRGHFRAAARARGEGVPLDGYFVWSLLDNFEWDRGYTQRFGIVWVDYATQQRIPKDSARYLAQVIASGDLG